MTCSGQNSVKIKLSSPFESLVCKLESMSSQIKLNISVFFSFYFTSLFTLSQFHKQSNRHEETLVGLAPPNEAPTSPQIEIWNSVNQCFYHIFRMSSPLAQTYKRKTPIEDFLATVLSINLTLLQQIYLLTLQLTPKRPRVKVSGRLPRSRYVIIH